MRKTHDQFVLELKDKNPNVIVSGKYIKSSIKIECKCRVCGYEFSSRPNDLLNGHGCPQCKKQNLSKLYKHTHEDFIHKLKNKNIDVNIISVYTGCHQNIHCKCNICNNNFDIIAGNLLKHGCPICGIKRRILARTKSHEDFVKELYMQNKNIEVIGKYINSKKPIKCLCKICGNKWFAIPDGLLGDKGTGCPHCRVYKGEKQITDYLEENKIVFERQKTYEDLVGIGGKKLSYDFYLPRKNLFIEYNGEQHYSPIDFFGGKDKFIVQQEHDKRKKEYINKMNARLLVIPYWDFNSIKDILDKELKEVA